MVAPWVKRRRLAEAEAKDAAKKADIEREAAAAEASLKDAAKVEVVKTAPVPPVTKAPAAAPAKKKASSPKKTSKKTTSKSSSGEN